MVGTFPTERQIALCYLMSRVLRTLERCQTTLGSDSEINEQGPCSSLCGCGLRPRRHCPVRSADNVPPDGAAQPSPTAPGPPFPGRSCPVRELSPEERCGSRPCVGPPPRGEAASGGSLAARRRRAEPCGAGEERGSARRSTRRPAVRMRPQRGGERERRRLPPAEKRS